MAISSNTVSKISVPVTTVNVPEPKSVKANFVYNFYVSNENTVAEGVPTSPIDYNAGYIDRETLDLIETKERGSLSARVPRYVVIDIGRDLKGIPSRRLGDLPPAERDRLLSIDSSIPGSGLDVYNLEGTIKNQYNAYAVCADKDVKTRIQSEIYQIARYMISNGGLTQNTSDVDIARALSSMTSGDVDLSSIMNALADNAGQGISYVNEISKKPYSKIDTRSSITYHINYNAGAYRETISPLIQANPFGKYFFSDIVEGAGSDTFPDRRNQLLNTTLFPTLNDTADVDPRDLFPEMKAWPTNFDFLSLVQAANILPKIEHIGYIIERYEKNETII